MLCLMKHRRRKLLLGRNEDDVSSKTETPTIDVFHSDESVSENDQLEPTVRHSVKEKRHQRRMVSGSLLPMVRQLNPHQSQKQ